MRAKRRTQPEEMIFYIVALAAIVWMLSYAAVDAIPAPGRKIALQISGLALAAGAAGLVLMLLFRWSLLLLAWRHAFKSWGKSIQSQHKPHFNLAYHLTDGGLHHLAMQVYSLMGYIVTNRDDDDAVFIYLRNPLGRRELVRCRQQADTVDTEQVQELCFEARKKKASRAFYWAPGGFSPEASLYADKNDIVLVDNLDIGRLVECVHTRNRIYRYLIRIS
jgi:hypothetical protein